MIVRRLTWTLAGLGVLLGLGHLAFLSAAPRWALDVLWFALSGLAFIAVALLNVAALRAPADRVVRAMTVGADGVLAAAFAAAWLVLPQPQVIVGGLIFTGLAALTALGRARPV